LAGAGFGGTPHSRKIGERQKNETASKRPKEIVLVTGQNVARAQLRERVRNRANRIAGRDPEDGEINRPPMWGNQIVRSPTGVDEDALSANLG
jgi:hypothetical protein